MTDGPILAVEGFEGSLDFLLELARAERIDLRRLSVLAIVEALAVALEAALAGSRRRMDLTRWGEWLGMAAQVALWRSRLLLPPGSAEAQSALAAAAALRRLLLERDAVRSAAGWLEARVQLGRETFARGAPEVSLGGPALAGDITALFQACLVALRVGEVERLYRVPPPPLWRVSDATARIMALVRDRDGGGVLAAFLPSVRGELQSRAAVASTLVAGLELCRAGAITVEQARAFGPVAFSALLRE